LAFSFFKFQAQNLLGLEGRSVTKLDEYCRMTMTRPRIDQTDNQFEEAWSEAGRWVTENHSTGRL
jgi:hypothetical protein